MVNAHTMVGKVIYTFVVDDLSLVKKVLALLNKHQLLIHGRILHWTVVSSELCSETHRKLIIEAPLKPFDVLEHIADHYQWMMGRYGMSVEPLIDGVVFESVELCRPETKVAHPKVCVDPKTKKTVKVKKTLPSGLTINDFITSPLDPTSPLSKQWAYKKAWVEFDKYRKQQEKGKKKTKTPS